MSGTSRIISAPVECRCVFSLFSHCRFPHTISKAFPQTKPESVKKKKSYNYNQNPHVEKTLLEVIPKRITVSPAPKEKKVHSPLDPPEEGFVLGSSPPPAWTQVPLAWPFGIREQILLALHFTHPPRLFSTLNCLIKSALFSLKKKKEEKKDILSGHFVSRCITVQIRRL